MHPTPRSQTSTPPPASAEFYTEEPLPFDLRTTWLGLWAGRWRLLWMTGAVCLVAVAVAIVLGSRVFEAETVLLYQPAEMDASTSVLTQMNLVKIQPNLLAVREKLALAVPLNQLAGACLVDVQPNTNLLRIRAQWRSAAGAAAVANALRDQFLDNQASQRRAVLADRINDLEQQRVSVRQRLEEVELSLAQYTSNNKVMEADNKVQSLLQAFARVDGSYQRALVAKENFEVRGPRLNGSWGDLSEYSSEAGISQGVGEVDARIAGLLSVMHGNRERRANEASLAQARVEYDRARELIERGLISQNQLDQARTEFQRQHALVGDTEQTQEWTSEIRDLMTQRLQRLQQARNDIRGRLDELPQLQRRYVSIKRDVNFYGEELQMLDERIGRLRRAHESSVADFSIVSEAGVPPMPLSSNRRPLAAGVAVVGTLALFGWIVTRELLSPTLKSRAQLRLQTEAPVFSCVPHAGAAEDLRPVPTVAALRDGYGRAAHGLRQALPQRGVRILVTGLAQDEGVSLVAANVAASLGRRAEQVLLVDADFRGDARLSRKAGKPGKGAKGGKAQKTAAPGKGARRQGAEESRTAGYQLRSLIQAAPVKGGLGEFLSVDAVTPEEVTYVTTLAGVDCCPRVEDPAVPELLGSQRMVDFLDAATRRYSLVLVDAPAVGQGLECEWLASHCDAAVVVVRAGRWVAGDLELAIERLRVAGCPVVGTILNDVATPFQELG